MKKEILLEKIASRKNGGCISLSVKDCIKNNQHDECIKMLKSMTFDNERLMVNCFGQMLVNQIKLA